MCRRLVLTTSFTHDHLLAHAIQQAYILLQFIEYELGGSECALDTGPVKVRTVQRVA